MARKSQRLSTASQSTPQHKRAASSSAIPSDTAKRPRKGSAKQTPTKSQYFDKDDSNADKLTDEESVSDAASSEGVASEFGDEEDEDSPPTDSDGADEYDSEDDKPKRSRNPTSKKGATSSTAIRTKGQELWRPGVKAGLGPGNQVVIKKPKARPAGKTAYEDETIHPNTLLFLADLKANNDRQWLKSELPLPKSLLPSTKFVASHRFSATCACSTWCIALLIPVAFHDCFCPWYARHSIHAACVMTARHSSYVLWSHDLG